MSKEIISIVKKRRKYVYDELEKERENYKKKGKILSNSQKSKIMKDAWKEAKKKFK